MDELKELILLQQKPKLHIGVEEKIPTVQYGNKTITMNVSFHIDKVNKETIRQTLDVLNEIINEEKEKLKPKPKQLNPQAEKKVEKAVEKGFKTDKEPEKSMIEESFEQLGGGKNGMDKQDSDTKTETRSGGQQTLG